MMDPRTATPQPWWAEVEHLRTSPETGRHQTVTSSAARRAERHEVRSAARERGRGNVRAGERSSGRHRPAERVDWFAQEARDAGRVSRAPQPQERPARPRATLIDVAPAHAQVRRAPQVRRRAGERPTVTITGRPEAALPPQPAQVPALRAARTRERATAIVASPDRMILWAVALGLLMIIASVATAGA